jgi:hypothetical protein
VHRHKKGKQRKKESKEEATLGISFKKKEHERRNGLEEHVINRALRHVLDLQ